MAAQCGEVCDGSSAAWAHIWARSRLLAAAAPQAELRRLIKAALVVLRALARVVARRGLGAAGRGRWHGADGGAGAAGVRAAVCG